MSNHTEIIDLAEPTTSTHFHDIKQTAQKKLQNGLKRQQSQPVVKDSNRPVTREHFLEDGGILDSSRDVSMELFGNIDRGLGHSSNNPEDHVAVLFYVDVEPDPLPLAAAYTSPSSVNADETSSLLLPPHVSIFGNEPVEILPLPVADDDDDKYIDYLDYDDGKGDMLRYFEEQEEAPVKNKVVCKNCGAEGEHKTIACPVKICLTCGVRDEHSTRSCPISKTCFLCGMKGHINRDCPNPHQRSSEIDMYNACKRCGSEIHNGKECPTLWRLYEYHTEEGKDDVLYRRRGKHHLELGQGGEGYIADDIWCYNCGHPGHWGDDCQNVPHQGDRPTEPSAFGTHNILSGPFLDLTERKTTEVRHREPRDWERDGGWGNKVPEFVGKRGRKDHAAQMAKQALKLANEDEVEDWFEKARNPRNGRAIPTGPKTLRFGSRLRDNNMAPPPPEPTHPRTLLERLSDPSAYNDRRSERPLSSSERAGRKDTYRAGPRYRGGYSR